jgi:hypothetical protein
MKRQSVLALALLTTLGSGVCVVRADETFREKVGLERRDARDAETPEQFRDWAEGRMKDLRRDFKALDKRAENYAPDRRDKAKEKVSDLKERVSKAEGRLDEVGDRNTRDAWKTREEIRDELKDVRDDERGVRKGLDKTDVKEERRRERRY